MNKLPDRPSELLMVALTDMELCRADRRYEINMGHWHEPLANGKCSVCMAGSVMAKTLNIGRLESIESINIERLESVESIDLDVLRSVPDKKLIAIDKIRAGYVGGFARCLKLTDIESLDFDDAFNASDKETFPGEIYNLSELSNSKDPEHIEMFRNWILGFIGILQAEGL